MSAKTTAQHRNEPSFCPVAFESEDDEELSRIRTPEDAERAGCGDGSGISWRSTYILVLDYCQRRYMLTTEIIRTEVHPETRKAWPTVCSLNEFPVPVL